MRRTALVRARLLLAAQPKLVTSLLQVVHRAITRFLLNQAGLKAEQAEQADSSAVLLIQPSLPMTGSAANLHTHLHCLLQGGVCRRTDGEPDFVGVPAPTDETLQVLLHMRIDRLDAVADPARCARRRGGATHLADSDGDSDDVRAFGPLQAAACTYRVTVGPRAGQKVSTVQGAMPPDAARPQALCADEPGFSPAARTAAGASAGTKAAVPHHHASGVGQRAGSDQQRWAGGAQAEDTLA